MISRRQTAIALLCALGLAGVTACDVNEGPEEEFEEAAEETGEAVEETAEEAEESLEEAGDKIEEATD